MAGESSEIYKTLDLALRIGELLLSSGAGAADVSAQMGNVARACGLRRFTADVTFTELAMSHQASVDEPALLQIRQVRYRQIDFGDLTLVDHLVRDLVAGRIDRDEAATALNRIVSSGHSRPRWTVTVGLGVMGAGLGFVLGGDWTVALIAFVGACAIDVVQAYMAARRWPTFYQQVAGGLIATLLAAGVAATPLDVSPSRVITASIVLLLAGVSFLGAIQDALTGFPLTSGARMLEALIATAGAIAGVSGGLTLARVLHFGLGTLDPGSVHFAGVGIAAAGGAVTATAYAFSNYVPMRALLPIAVLGAVATAAYLVVNEHRVGVALASVVAAVVIGVVSFGLAGQFRVPALVIVTASIVPLLPGLSIYRGLALFSQGGQGGLTSIATAGAVAIALSSGAIFGQYLAQPLRREARRLENRLAGPRLVGPLTARGARERHRRRKDDAERGGWQG